MRRSIGISWNGIRWSKLVPGRDYKSDWNWKRVLADEKMGE